MVFVKLLFLRSTVEWAPKQSCRRAYCMKSFPGAIAAENKAMELMGAFGYVRDYDVEKYWRDCKMIQLWEGGAQLGRLDVCRGYYDLDL